MQTRLATRLWYLGLKSDYSEQLHSELGRSIKRKSGALNPLAHVSKMSEVIYPLYEWPFQKNEWVLEGWKTIENILSGWGNVSCDKSLSSMNGQQAAVVNVFI